RGVRAHSRLTRFGFARPAARRRLDRKGLGAARADAKRGGVRSEPAVRRPGTPRAALRPERRSAGRALGRRPHAAGRARPAARRGARMARVQDVGGIRRRRPYTLPRRGPVDRARGERTRSRVQELDLSTGVIDAVVFDLDGVIVDSEQLWDDVREQLARERGGRWTDHAQRDMMGMSSSEWSRYMHDVVGLPESPDEINSEVVQRLLERYSEQLPLIDGAADAVRRLAGRWPLALATSSNREVIEEVLGVSGLTPFFQATVSSEEVAKGKPAPDVYLDAARRLGVNAPRCAAIEDSSNGIRAGRAAGMRVIAIPNARYPPDEDALALADVVLESIRQLDVNVVDDG